MADLRGIALGCVAAEQPAGQCRDELGQFRVHSGGRGGLFVAHTRPHGERVLKELLPIVDDFELAVKHARESKSEEDPIVEGLLLIYNKLIGYLEKQGVVRIEATGAPFDDNLHEAVAMIPAPTPEQKGQVIDCVRTGYMLHDKVLRHAHVVVGN